MNGYPARVARRAWVPVVAAVVAGAVAYLLGGSLTPEPTQYESRAVLRVHDPGDDVRMAPTYASVLTNHTALLTDVAARSGMTVDELKDALTAHSIQSTSLVELTGTGPRADHTRRMVQNLVADVVGPRPYRAAVSPSSLTVVSPASPGAAVSGGGLPTVPLTALLGLLAGLVAAVALDRADPRADSCASASRATGTPTLAAGDRGEAVGSVGDVGSLLRRWQDGDGVGDRLVVTVVPVCAPRGTQRAASEAAADVLRAAARTAGVPEADLVVAAPGDAALAGSAADRCVLAVQRGAVLARLTELRDRLHATGKDADLTLLVPRRPARTAAPAGADRLHDVDWLLEHRAGGRGAPPGRGDGRGPVDLRDEQRDARPTAASLPEDALP